MKCKTLLLAILLLTGCATHPYEEGTRPEEVVIDFTIRQIGNLATNGTLDGATVARDAYQTGSSAARDAYWRSRNAINQYERDTAREQMILQKENELKAARIQVEREYMIRNGLIK